MIGLLYSAVRNVDVHNFQRFHEEQLEAIERMTSGKAINRASDDVASMGHLSKMQAEALGTNQSIRNSNDAYSYAEVGDTALADCEEALHRMKELAIQSMNGANTSQDIEAIEKEFDHWKEIFAQVVENTEFAGDRILNDKTKWFQTNWKPTEITTFDPVYLASNQVGSNKMISDGTMSNAKGAVANYSSLTHGITDADSFTIKGTFGEATISLKAAETYTAYSIANLVNQNTQTTGVRAEAVTYAKLSNLSAAGDVLFNLHGRSSAQIAVKIEDKNELGALMNAINEKTNITGITAELTDNRSAIILCNDEGYDIGIENFEHSTDTETIALTGLESDGVTATAGGAQSIQGNIKSSMVGGHMILKSPKDFSVSSTSGELYSNSTMISSFVDLASSSVDTFDNAIDALDAVDGTLNQVVDTRSRFGQVMQRLEHNASGLQNSLAALEQSRSRREDTDFAAEMVKNFRAKYMSRTNLSVSTVANKMSQTALQLL